MSSRCHLKFVLRLYIFGLKLICQYYEIYFESIQFIVIKINNKFKVYKLYKWNVSNIINILLYVVHKYDFF